MTGNTSTLTPPAAAVKMFPKAEYETPLDYLKNVVGIYLVVAFAPFISALLIYVVGEKENKIKESMKIMGLNMSVFWLSWFITYAVVIIAGMDSHSEII